MLYVFQKNLAKGIWGEKSVELKFYESLHKKIKFSSRKRKIMKISLFREYVAQLIEYDKKFLIIGHQNAITYK